MANPQNISIYGNRGQGIILVLYSLDQIGGAGSKQEVLNFIQDAGFYDITRHDLPAYDGQNEPKYHTLLAWARKDALIAEWLIKGERNLWQISREGRSKIRRIIVAFRDGRLDVRLCYLWTPKFKTTVFPEYVPSENDAVRPEERVISWSGF